MISKLKYSYALRVLCMVLLFLNFSTRAISQSVTLSIPDYTVGENDPNIMMPVLYEVIGTDMVAFTLDIIYDSAVLNPVGCTIVEFGACNPAFVDTVKLAFLSLTVFPNNSDLAFVEFDIIGNAGDISLLDINVVNAYDINQQAVTNVNVNPGKVTIFCESNIFYSATEDFSSTSMEHIEADNSITAVNAIYAGADIIYDAGDCVLLDGGFEVISGATFEVLIDGCGGL